MFRKRIVDEVIVKEALGRSPIGNRPKKTISRPGQAIGLAYTSLGGAALMIEAERFPGNGSIVLTGHLGDVMKESVSTALAWIRANAVRLRLAKESSISVVDDHHLDDHKENAISSLLTGYDLHVNFPAAAIPKDGPSAGITITTCLVSLFTFRRMRPETAMTGEVSLHGDVLPVGGIKEKLIGALRNGVTHVILPEGNREDAEDLSDDIKK